MNLLQQAYQELYPTKRELRALSLSYSGRFKAYNANICKTRNEITAQLSKQWRGVSPDIQKGLLQELLVKLFKTKKQTINMDLYHNFIRSLSSVSPITHTHPILEQSFQRVNEQFFNGIMHQPNLCIGKGLRQLGTYEYGTNTVSISKILLVDETLLDYVMYHELLHTLSVCVCLSVCICL